MNNTIELIGYYGNDQVHACSAWTSTSRDLNPEKVARIPKLLKMLAESGHHTPFEKSSLHFLVDTDIASHIHLIKHRIGVSINGESARYKEIKDDKYIIPDDWKDVAVAPKHGLHPYKTWDQVLNDHSIASNRLYHCALKDLELSLGRKRAKESARFFKMYNSQIESDVMFNWRSFYHFLNLRNKLDAQKEIREVAAEMLRLVKTIDGNPFEHTISAFNL